MSAHQPSEALAEIEQEKVRRPWHVYRTTFVSTAVVICSTLGVYVLGVLGPSFTDELGIPTTDLSWFTSAIFITAALSSIPLGTVADRSKVAPLAALQLVVSGASLAALAFVLSFWMIIPLCVIMGLITAMHSPLANRTVAGYVDASQFKFVIGWRSLGPQIGSLLVGVLIAPLVQVASWRVVVASLGVAIMLAAIPLYRAIRKSDAYVAEMELKAPEKKAPAGPIPTRPPSVVFWLMSYTLFQAGAVVTIGAYMPSFGVEDFGMTIGAAGVASGVTAVASLLGRGMWLKFLTEHNEKLLMLLGALTAALALGFLALSPSIGVWAFWVAAVLSGMTALGTSPLGQIVLMRHCPPAYIGRASALTGMSMFAASIVQPLLFGAVAGVWGIHAGWLVIGGGSLIACLVITTWMITTRLRGKPAATSAAQE